jgi:hypothetical protein
MRHFLIALLVLSAGCSEAVRNDKANPRLAAIDSTYRNIESTLVFELPDDGKFIVNGQPIAQADIPAKLTSFFGGVAPEQRAVMVKDNPKRRADEHWISRAAVSAGGQAFDAELSGWTH